MGSSRPGRAKTIQSRSLGHHLIRIPTKNQTRISADHGIRHKLGNGLLKKMVLLVGDKSLRLDWL